jgi:hypothetical protein
MHRLLTTAGSHQSGSRSAKQHYHLPRRQAPAVAVAVVVLAVHVVRILAVVITAAASPALSMSTNPGSKSSVSRSPQRREILPTSEWQRRQILQEACRVQLLRSHRIKQAIQWRRRQSLTKQHHHLRHRHLHYHYRHPILPQRSVQAYCRWQQRRLRLRRRQTHRIR